jgi:hypothetical protein
MRMIICRPSFLRAACTRQMGQADRILDGLSLADDDAKSKLGCDFFLTRQNGKPAVRALDTRIVCARRLTIMKLMSRRELPTDSRD